MRRIFGVFETKYKNNAICVGPKCKKRWLSKPEFDGAKREICFIFKILRKKSKFLLLMFKTRNCEISRYETWDYWNKCKKVKVSTGGKTPYFFPALRPSSVLNENHVIISHEILLLNVIAKFGGVYKHLFKELRVLSPTRL